MWAAGLKTIGFKESADLLLVRDCPSPSRCPGDWLFTLGPQQEGAYLHGLQCDRPGWGVSRGSGQGLLTWNRRHGHCYSKHCCEERDAGRCISTWSSQVTRGQSFQVLKLTRLCTDSFLWGTTAVFMLDRILIHWETQRQNWNKQNIQKIHLRRQDPNPSSAFIYACVV